MRLEHVAVEVLLQAVVIIGGVGQGNAVDACLARKGLDDGLSLGIDHLLAALPVVDGERTVVVAADHVDGAGHVHIEVVDGPLLTIGVDVVVAHEAEELLLLVFNGNLFGLTVVAEGADGVEGAVAEPVLGLFVDEGAHLGSHAAIACPLVERLLDGNAIALPLAQGLSLSVEGPEEEGD